MHKIRINAPFMTPYVKKLYVIRYNSLLNIKTMKVSVHKNRFYFALIPCINIYAWWLIELSWLNITVNIRR